MSEIPVHLRNPDTYKAEVFDHPGFIAEMCKWWKPKVFLEYGLSSCPTTSRIYPHCEKVIGVDMKYHPNMAKIPNLEFYEMKTSDFKAILDQMKTKVDIAFIDACHKSEVAFKDFKDVFPHVIEDGLIFLHDTYPMSAKYTDPVFCDDCWKLPHLIQQFYGDKCEVLTIPVQPGLTMVRKTTKNLSWMNPETIDWSKYE